MTRPRPGRFLITCQRCGFCGVRGVVPSGPHPLEGLCRHRGACDRRRRAATRIGDGSYSRPYRFADDDVAWELAFSTCRTADRPTYAVLPDADADDLPALYKLFPSGRADRLRPAEVTP